MRSATGASDAAMGGTSGKTIQALWLMAGQLCSLLFGLGTLAVLSRYLTPEEYGTYRQVFYVYQTLLMLFSLGMPRAYSYFLVRMPAEEGRSFVGRMRRMFLALGAVFSASLYVGAGLIARALDNPALEPALRIFAPTPLLLMPVLGIESLLVALDRARLNAVYLLTNRSLTAAGVLLPVVAGGWGVPGAVGGSVAAALLSLGIGSFVERMPFRGLEPRPTGVSVREILGFSLPLFLAGVWGFVILSVSPFFIGRYLGASAFALYANGYVELPLAAWIVNASSVVLLPAFSRMRYEGEGSREIVGLWTSVILKSAKVIYPLAVFCCVFASPVMEWVYGTEYRAAGVLLQLVTPVVLLRVVPFSPVLLALGKGRTFSNIHLVTALVLTLAEALCVRWFPSLAAVAAVQTLCTVGCLAAAFRAVGASVQTGWRQLLPLRSLAALLLLSLFASGASRLLVGSVSGGVALAGAFLLAAALYAGACAVCGVSYRELAQPLLALCPLRLRGGRSEK